MNKQQLKALETQYTKGVTSHFYREDKPRKWLKPQRLMLRGKRRRVADTVKFCTCCGVKMLPPMGEVQEVWYKVRRCSKCLNSPRKSVAERGGKFCMNCGKFFPLKELLKMGAHPQKGVSAWATCGCTAKKS